MARWEDPIAVLGRGYHLAVALRDRVTELEAQVIDLEHRWDDRAALEARLADLIVSRPR